MRRIELVGKVQSDTTRNKNNISILFRCWILISFDSRQAGITRTPALARCSCCTRCPIRKTFHCTFSWLKIFSLYALYNKNLSFSGYHILPSLPFLTRGPYQKGVFCQYPILELGCLLLSISLTLYLSYELLRSSLLATCLQYPIGWATLLPTLKSWLSWR